MKRLLDEGQYLHREFARRIRSAFVSIEKTRRHTWRSFFLLSCLASLTLHASPLSRSAAAATPNPAPVALGQSVVALNGPWKFHTGDNPLWAEPNFDDSTWETVDLTPPPGAHDFDVGLTGYVPGWQARAHRGYFGYAWYRIRVSVNAPLGETLALCGPFYVDSAYQVFLNGRLLGGMGNFSGPKPVAYNNHLPKIFPLPQSFASASSENEGPALLAVRVWMGPWALGSPETGGIHIAPALGTTSGVDALYQRQWVEMIRGYIVDAVEALLFLVLAVMACSLIPFDRSNPAYLWLAAALILVGLARGNQAVFFWGQFETVHGFELFTIVLFVPLSLATWTLAWCTWFRVRDRAWMPVAVGILALLHMGVEVLRRSWFYGVFPHWFGVAARYSSMWVRLLFVLLTLLIIFRGMSRQGREKWFTLPAVLLISVGLFAQELSMLHVPGIWFPFGTGVSRTEYAYAAFDVALFVLLLRRLYALRQQPAIT
jgi:hypothetical protein